MTPHLFYLCLDIAAIVLITLCAIRVVQLAPTHRNAWLIVAICIGGLAYILSARQDYGYYIPAAYDMDWGDAFPLLNIARNATTGLFALLAWSLFSDRQRLPRWLVALFILQLGLEEPAGWVVNAQFDDEKPAYANLLLEVLPAAIQLVFVATALYWLLKDRKADLVETRRRARFFLFAIYIAQVVLSLGVERIATFMGWIPWQLHYPIHVFVVATGMVVSVLALLALVSPQARAYLAPNARSSSLQTNATANAQQARLQQTEADAAAIVGALEEQHLYRQVGLSIGKLAAHLGIPEYRVRTSIHQQLGYRNFNALLHHYRLQEIAAALKDPSTQDTPILTLALTAGYQSINPFNRAFREQFGVTPSEYRRRT